MKTKFSFFALIQWLILLVALGAVAALVPLSGLLYGVLVVALSLACIQFAQSCSDLITLGRRSE